MSPISEAGRHDVIVARQESAQSGPVISNRLPMGIAVLCALMIGVILLALLDEWPSGALGIGTLLLVILCPLLDLLMHRHHGRR